MKINTFYQASVQVAKTYEFSDESNFSIEDMEDEARELLKQEIESQKVIPETCDYQYVAEAE